MPQKYTFSGPRHPSHHGDFWILLFYNWLQGCEKSAVKVRDYYFYVAPNEEEVDLGWEFTISDLIESEFETNPDNFPDKAAKIEFLKELIADIEECIEKVEKEEDINEG